MKREAMPAPIDRSKKEEVGSDVIRRGVLRKMPTRYGHSRSGTKFSSFRSRTSRKTRTFIIIVIIAMSASEVSPKQYEEFLCNFLRYKEECTQKLNETWTENMAQGNYCRGGFDGFICWPHGTPNSPVNESCPPFLPWSNSMNDSSKGFRFCMEDGSWYKHPKANGELEIWNYRTKCNPFQEDTTDAEIFPNDQQKELIEALEVAYTIGYAVSLCCLVVALILLTFFKKLHCTRNYIHMNLMISFIVRYVAVLVKDRVIAYHYAPAQFPSMDSEELKLYCDDFGGVSSLMVSCRVVVILMHYAIVANYFWLLAEGLYLQLILIFVMKSDQKYFPAFMAFGWGGPWIPVGVWIALRLAFDNVGCWEMFDSYNIWWALRGPVILSIAINFLIFINIVRIIVSKLRARNISRNDYKYRLAKSTLALIPLLGIHYIIFLIVDDQISSSNRTIMNVKICFEMTFTSIQGALISILYCFMNGEVQGEVRKLWNHWRISNGLPAVNSRKCSTFNSNGATQMTSVMSGHNEYTTTHEVTLLTPIDRKETTTLSVPENGNIRPSYHSSEQPLLANGGHRPNRDSRDEESM